MEVSGSDWNKVRWKVVEDHVVGEGNEYDETGLLGLVLICLMKIKGGG